MRFVRLAGKMPGYVFYPIQKSPAFFVFMFVLGYVCNRIGTPTFSELGIFELFVDIYALCLVMAFLPWRVRLLAKGIIYVVMYSASIVDMYCKVKFGTNFSPTMLLLISETTGREASEFMKTYVNIDLLRTDLGWVALIMACHILYNVFMTVARRKRIHLNTDMAAVRLLSAAVLPLLGLVCIYMLEQGIAKRADNKKAFARLMAYENIGDVERELTRKDRAELYLPVYRVAFSFYANSLAARQTATLIDGAKRVSVDSCSYLSPNIVLIIGESYNRHHSQLYGYDKSTTPRQAERARGGQMAVFSDVVASWNLTSFVFKHVFSLYTVGDSGDWSDYPLFPEVFRRAGYRVTFVTNQFLPQAREAVYDFSGGFFLNNPTLSKEQFDVRNTTLHALDDGVLADYDSIVSHGHMAVGGSDDRNLVILHLKGQHVNYAQRYPRGRRHFAASDYDTPTLLQRDKEIMAHYDNATLYNDSIVDEIIKRFEDSDAIVIYMADHGEECFGDGLRVYGRLHTPTTDYRLAHEEFEIPFWIWWSESYAKARPHVTEAIKAACRQPFMTDRLAHLLLYLGGISCPEYRDDCNPLSPNYDADRPRLLKNDTDYNQLKRDYEENHKHDDMAVEQ